MSEPLSVDWLRRHFATAAAPAASLYGDEGTLAERAQARTPAAVLVPIVDRGLESPAQSAAGLTILLTVRAPHLKMHSGQVSFPGGRIDPQDASPESAALREAREEIGLDAGRVELLGRLPDYLTGTGYRITPVVAVVSPPFDLRPDPAEVSEVFEVPLAVLLDPANHRRDSREFRGRIRKFFVIPHERHYIWGATAGMLVNLHRFLAQGAGHAR
jgi:8-oxo-dGTP pyrophosphatase MutT (NUDIX family)